MYCNTHRNTELMARLESMNEHEIVQILYCPHCRRDMFRLRVNTQGEETLEALAGK